MQAQYYSVEQITKDSEKRGAQNYSEERGRLHKGGHAALLGGADYKGQREREGRQAQYYSEEITQERKGE